MMSRASAERCLGSRCPTCRLAAHQNRLVMLDGRERVVEVMQQPLPHLILWRPSEADGVVLDGLPVDQQQEAAAGLDAAMQRMRDVAWHGSDDRLCAGESRFELRLAPRLDVENGYFQYHAFTFGEGCSSVVVGTAGPTGVAGTTVATMEASSAS